jgi:O-6-methylguanine DNA methyltransferase
MTRRPPSDAPGDFARRVYRVVSRIPVGRVTTYGAVARMAGRPRAARAVGQLMRTAKHPHLPYHRVVAAGGRIGGYGGAGTAMKAALLRAEGTAVRGTRIVDFENKVWAATQRAPVSV